MLNMEYYKKGKLKIRTPHIRMNFIATRKHSSRMRTAYLPTVFHQIPCLGEGWVPIPWGPMCVCVGGSYPPPLDIPITQTIHPQILTTGKDMGLKIPTLLVDRMTDRRLWKHYLPSTSLVGDNYIRDFLKLAQFGNVGIRGLTTCKQKERRASDLNERSPVWSTLEVNF